MPAAEARWIWAVANAARRSRAKFRAAGTSYGPRDTDVFQFLKSVAKGLTLEIAGGGRWFSAIYVKDLADGLVVAARNPRAAGRTYFLAGPRPVSLPGPGRGAGRPLVSP